MFTLDTGQRMPRGGVEVKLYSFFNLGARWVWVVDATTRPLSPGNDTRYPLNTRLDRPQCWSERLRKIRPQRVSNPGPSSS